MIMWTALLWMLHEACKRKEIVINITSNWFLFIASTCCAASCDFFSLQWNQKLKKLRDIKLNLGKLFFISTEVDFAEEIRLVKVCLRWDLVSWNVSRWKLLGRWNKSWLKLFSCSWHLSFLLHCPTWNNISHEFGKQRKTRTHQKSNHDEL